MLSFLPPTPQEVMQNLKIKFRQRRKELKYTQKELSERSEVSLGSLKRFESSGQISLESLLKLALVLDCLEGFGLLCRQKEVKSIEEMLNEK